MMNTLRLAVVCLFILTVILPCAQSATNTFHVTGGNGLNYVIDGVNDPTNLTLVRGYSYFFDVTVSAIHPFFIRTTAGANLDEADGVTNNGATSAIIEFAVPLDAPDQLKYQCGVHAGMTGPLHILDPPNVNITGFDTGTNVIIESTGYDSDILDTRVLTDANLSSNSWTEAAILVKSHSTEPISQRSPCRPVIRPSSGYSRDFFKPCGPSSPHSQIAAPPATFCDDT